MQFYASDITEITGVKRLRLHTWIEKGYIEPSIQKGQGPGSRNIFSRDDVYRIVILKRLVENGFLREEAARLANVDFDLIEDRRLKHDNVGKLHTLFKHTNLSGKEYEYVVFCRYYNRGKAQIVPTRYFAEDQITIHDALLQALPYADDIFMINLKRLKDDIDKKISEVIS